MTKTQITGFKRCHVEYTKEISEEKVLVKNARFNRNGVKFNLKRNYYELCQYHS